MNTIVDQNIGKEKGAAGVKLINGFARQLRVVVPAIAVLLLWELSADFGWVDVTFVGRPSEILPALIDQLKLAAFWRDVGITFKEVALGFITGILSGGAVGYVLGMKPRWAAILEPYILALNAIPKVAIAPILIVLLGVGTTSKVVISASMVFFLMFYAVYIGLKTLNVDFVYQAKLMGCGRWAVIRYVIVPSLMPNILGGMKTSVVYAMIGAIVGEYIAADGGLGHFVLAAAGAFNMNDVWVGTIVLMAMVLGISATVGLLERRLLRWLPPKKS